MKRLQRSAVSFVVAMAAAAAGCGNGPTSVLNQQADAHRIAARLHVEFTRAADASNRAVMADTDEASRDAAHAAEQATQQIERDLDTLRGLVAGQTDHDEFGLIDRFKALFTQYRALDAEILPLAIENTNIKAQRLAFGPAQDAVTAFRASLDAAVRLAAPKNTAAADALASHAGAAVLEIQVTEARHIAESDETAMSRMEAAMTASGDAARKAVEELRKLLPPGAGPQLAAAAEALDRLTATNAEIVALSRRNSNVRSLALSLGKKRAITAQGEEILQTLEDALASHHFSATR